MKKNTNEATPKPFYLPKRDCQLSMDGKYYCYSIWDEASKRMLTQEIEVGKDLSLDITLVLDELDHDDDLQEYYERKRRNHAFNREVKNYQFTPDNDDLLDPWEKIGERGSSPEDIIFAESKVENPQVAMVRFIINEKCTEEQKKFIADHFGREMQMEEMRRVEAKQTGKLPSAAAMTSRKNKILDKIAKALGVQRIKRHKYPNRKD